jgi:hypothetical protein
LLLVVKNTTQESSTAKFELLGFAAIHNFFRYPESTRLRISQVGPLTSVHCFHYTCLFNIWSIFLKVFHDAAGLYFLLLHPFRLSSVVKVSLVDFLTILLYFLRYWSCRLIRVKAMVVVFLRQSILSHNLRTYMT